MPNPQPADNRTLVDRLLDRIKNNRIFAAAMIAGLAIGGVASLTESAKKLADALPPFANVSVAGEWKSDQPATFYSGGGPSLCA